MDDTISDFPSTRLLCKINNNIIMIKLKMNLTNSIAYLLSKQICYVFLNLIYLAMPQYYIFTAQLSW